MSSKTPSQDLSVGQRTDPGPRPVNQDFTGVEIPADARTLADRGRLFVVADGMGGHDGGAVASRMAVETLASTFRDAATSDPWTILTEGFAAANQAILAAAEGEGLHGMGTTLTAMILKGRRVYIAHAGDSRCYRLRGSELTLLTEDHSFVNRLLRDGLINDEEAREHSHRNVITNAVGMKDMHVEPRDDLVEAGDVYLLCSDGLHKALDAGTISGILARDQETQAAADRLIEAARPRADDNISVVIVRILALPPAGPDQGRTRRTDRPDPDRTERIPRP